MKGYRFITDDDTIDFCQRVTEALSNGWKLHGEPKMTFDHKRKVMRCGQAVVKQSSKKYIKGMDLAKIYICMALPSTLKAASFTASLVVG